MARSGRRGERARRREQQQRAAQRAPLGTSLGALLRQQGIAPAAGAEPASEEGGCAAEPAPVDRAAAGERPSRADTQRLLVRGTVRLRRERKGRRGKTVTWIEGLEARHNDLAALARALGKALGCGASVQGGGAILLQGEIVERAAR
ncbi:MAG: hypothetical protein D6776_12135, partial [Planctomycetota bacterium]